MNPYGQVVSWTDCSVNGASSNPTCVQVFSAVQRFSVAGFPLSAFYDAITGPTEFISSLVNFGKNG